MINLIMSYILHLAGSFIEGENMVSFHLEINITHFPAFPWNAEKPDISIPKNAFIQVWSQALRVFRLTHKTAQIKAGYKQL